ncbi:MAG TPA: MBL fold metallo-hydrolase [Desulfopila sp.]|nr:MBL fold metallo-hydrolase [Desulfopila sp.]
MTIVQHTLNTPYMVGPVHCYSIDVGGELVLFDTGPPTESAKKYLQENLDLRRLRYIFITHCHIDHYGLARWLEKNTDARLFLPYRDGLKILSHADRLQDMYSLLESLGFGGSYLDGLHRSLADNRIFPPFPQKFGIVEDDMPGHMGMDFLACPGHSQSDIVYYTDDWAVTGDTLLRGVFQSPLLDADLETGERFANYEAYCSTLVKLASLRGRRICPSHKEKVDSIDETIVFYVTKMLGRARQLGEHAENTNVAEVIERLFGGSLTEPFHVYLKASEIVFMQDFLRQPQLLQRSLEQVGLFARLEKSFTKAVSCEELRR